MPRNLAIGLSERGTSANRSAMYRFQGSTIVVPPPSRIISRATVQPAGTAIGCSLPPSPQVPGAARSTPMATGVSRATSRNGAKRRASTDAPSGAASAIHAT